MFHHAHVYVATKLYQSKESLLILGSFLPDLAVMGIIKWEGGLHGEKSSSDFSKYIQKNPAYLDLSDGVIAHNVLDDFTHLEYLVKPGYAFQNTQDLAKLVGQYYGLEGEKAKGIAHNFVEMAVDIMLLHEQPEVQTQIRKAVEEIDREGVSELLGLYFNLDKSKFSDTLAKYWALFTKYDFSRADNWILFWGELEPLLALKNIGNEKRRTLLEAALLIINDTYKNFINYSITEGFLDI